VSASTLDFGSYTVSLPAGWSDSIEEEGTYSNPHHLPPIVFSARGGAGSMHVQILVIRSEDEEPNSQEADRADVQARARDWGLPRGVRRPEMCEMLEREDASVGTATFKLRRDFVQVWFLSNGSDLVHASYRCPWDRREEEQEAREALVASIRFRA
jgi:hypothetical protein